MEFSSGTSIHRICRVQQGERVLDVGSGTGSLTLALAASIACSEVVGIDPSEPYIEFARKRTSDPRVRFDVGDAKSLPYADNYFDKVLSQLVLNQVRDAPRAVQEMARVNKPGGIIAACVWTAGKENERNHLFWEAAIAVDPAAEQKRETEGGYGLKGRLAALWTQCGLKQIAECDLMCSVEFTRFDEFWLPHLEGQAHSGSYVKSLPSNLRDALRDRLRQDILGTKPDGRFSISAKSLAVRGIP